MIIAHELNFPGAQSKDYDRGLMKTKGLDFFFFYYNLNWHEEGKVVLQICARAATCISGQKLIKNLL